MRILFFDDDAKSFERLSRPLAHRLPGAAEIARCEPEGTAFKGLSPVEIARHALSSPTDADLVVLDFDLTAYNPPIPSELVQLVCQEEGFPVCLYTFQKGERERADYLLKWREHLIALDLNQSRKIVTARVAAYANGFQQIRSEILDAKSGELRDLSEAILHPPSGSELRLQQYQLGGSVPIRLLELRAGTRQSKSSKKRIVRLQSSLFGYWIVNELLKFPGVLLNDVAASSYLDVDAESFHRRGELRKEFEDALYTGPFSDTGQYWWSSEIDRLLASSALPSDQSVPSGFSFLRRKGYKVSRSRCIEGHLGAGYFCMITGKPVCEEHSVRPAAVFPVGADRSRIHRRAYRRIVPTVPM